MLPFYSMEVALKELEFPMVKVLELGEMFSEVVQITIHDLVKMAKGYITANKRHHREGIVVRSVNPIGDINKKYIVFKVINDEYLLNQK